MKFRFTTSVLSIFLLVGMAVAAHAATVRGYSKGAFNNALKSGPVVVHVHADWCIVCKRQMKPLAAELAKGKYGKVKAFRVNYDRHKSFLRRYRVSSQSTILVFRGGKLVAKSVGQTSAGVIGSVVGKAI